MSWRITYLFISYKRRRGIYVRASGLLEFVSCIIDRDFLRQDQTWILDFAARCLLLHEFFHHAVEVARSRIEYPFLAEGLGNNYYAIYFRQLRASYVEEAVANAYVARNIDRYYQNLPKPATYEPVRQALFTAMTRQPEPYCNFGDYVANQRYTAGRDLLVDRMYDPFVLDARASTAVDAARVCDLLLGRHAAGDVLPDLFDT